VVDCQKEDTSKRSGGRSRGKVFEERDKMIFSRRVKVLYGLRAIVVRANSNIPLIIVLHQLYNSRVK